MDATPFFQGFAHATDEDNCHGARMSDEGPQLAADAATAAGYAPGTTDHAEFVRGWMAGFDEV